MFFFKPKKKENKTLKIALIISGCVALAAAVAVVVTKLIQKCAKKKAECCCECTEAEELLVEDAVDAEIDGQKQKYFHKHHFTSVKVADAEDFVEMNGYEPWTVSPEEGAATGLLPGDVYATRPQSNKFLVVGGGGTQFDAKGLNLLKVNPTQGDTAANMAVYDQIRFVLDKIREYGAQHRDYDGKLVPLNYSQILMPSNSKLKKAIVAALGASLTEGPFEGPMKGDQYTLDEWAYLNGLPGFGNKEHGLLLIDPDRNRRALGFTIWDRVPLTVKSYLQDGNGTMVWAGRARFKADTCYPYAVVYAAFGDLANLSAQAYSGTTSTKFTSAKGTSDSNAMFIDLTDFELYDSPIAKE
jgi:hypothetical protein